MASASAGLNSSDRSGWGRHTFVLALLVGLVGVAVVVHAVVRSNSRGVPVALLLVASTYGAALAVDRAGPLSAGLLGLALLGLGWASHYEIRRVQSVPAQTLRWSRRAVLAVTGATVLLDAVVALTAGGGAPAARRLPSTLSILAGCLAVSAIVAVVTAVADGSVRPGPAQDHATGPAE